MRPPLLASVVDGRPLLVAAALLGLFASTGCGDGRPKRVAVSGKVLIDGKPMEYGIIQVMPKDNRASTSTIAEDGSFTLGCFASDDGCVLGEHPVRIDGRKPMGLTKVKWYAPKRFAFTATSGLSVSIEEPTNDLLIELQTGESKPFTPFVEVIARGVTDEEIRKADTPF